MDFNSREALREFCEKRYNLIMTLLEALGERVTETSVEQVSEALGSALSALEALKQAKDERAVRIGLEYALQEIESAARVLDTVEVTDARIVNMGIQEKVLSRDHPLTQVYTDLHSCLNTCFPSSRSRN